MFRTIADSVASDTTIDGETQLKLAVRGNNPSIGGRWFGAIVLSAHQAEQVVVGSSMKKLYTRTALPGLGQHEVVPGDGGVWRYRPPVPTRGRVGPF